MRRFPVLLAAQLGSTEDRIRALALPRTVMGRPALAPRSRLGWPDRISLPILLTWLMLLAAGLYVVGFLIAGGLRLFYPYPMEATEDASVQVVRHILQGQPMYGPTSLEYVTVIYTPLYFYLSAFVALITGGGFLPLRLVSFVASIGSAAVIYALVRRETASRAMGLVSAGLFVGSTILALDTLDLARVDALGVCLLLGAVYAMRTADFQPHLAVRMSALAGLLAALAILTKQTNAVVALALLAYAAPSPRTRLAPYTLVLGMALVTGLVAIYAQAGEWARVYLYDQPGTHSLDDKHLANFWSDAVLPHFTLPLVIGPVFLVGRAVRRDFRAVAFYVLVVVSMLSMAWGGWANRGSAFNVLEPAFAVLSVLFGLGVSEGLSRLAGGTGTQQAFRSYMLAVCLVQFLIVGYNPRSTVPLRSDGWAGDRLAATIADLPGTVFAPGFGEWSRRAGKGDQPAYGALMEIAGTSGGHLDIVGGRWQADLDAALKARRYDYLLLDPTSDAFFLKGAADRNGYVDTGPLFKPGDEFYLWRGGITPDAHLYVPVERAATRSAEP
jgi:4-amino-4-deoxy-L-arabinose transferase-like glycosyltransferase